MIALDPDGDRIQDKAQLHGRGWDQPSLGLWLRHLPSCNTAGYARLSCTCGLFRLMEELEARQPTLKAAWLAFKGHVGHHGHCGAPEGGSCVCGLHLAFPELFRS